MLLKDFLVPVRRMRKWRTCMRDRGRTTYKTLWNERFVLSPKAALQLYFNQSPNLVLVSDRSPVTKSKTVLRSTPFCKTRHITLAKQQHTYSICLHWEKQQNSIPIIQCLETVLPVSQIRFPSLPWPSPQYIATRALRVRLAYWEAADSPAGQGIWPALYCHSDQWPETWSAVHLRAPSREPCTAHLKTFLFVPCTR